MMKSQLTLGPVLYLWEAETWRDFYFRIADEAPVDIVSIGEVVCSKRQHFHTPYLAAVAERLQAAGKMVRLATLALVTLEREQRLTRDLAAQQDFELEINDLSALPALAGRSSTIGPLINVYNGATARFLASMGASSICLPPELPLDSVRAICATAPELTYEVFAFGRVPLALSARCAHARIKGLTKDKCQFICGEEPDGLVVETLDKQPFLAVNGIQTMSYTCQTSITDLAELQEAGVARFRLSPQRCDMVAVAESYRDVLTGRLDPLEGLAQLQALYPDAPMANGFLHGVPGAELIAGGRP